MMAVNVSYDSLQKAYSLLIIRRFEGDHSERVFE